MAAISEERVVQDQRARERLIGHRLVAIKATPTKKPQDANVATSGSIDLLRPRRRTAPAIMTAIASITASEAYIPDSARVIGSSEASVGPSSPWCSRRKAQPMAAAIAASPKARESLAKPSRSHHAAPARARAARP